MPERGARRYSQHFHLLQEPEEDGAPQGSERDAWSDRCCGLACLRSVLDAHDLAVPTQTSLLRQAIAIGAYTDAGMVHQRLVDLARPHGLDGRAVPVGEVAELALLADRGLPSVASVTHQLPEDGRRGGHLVVVAGSDAEDVVFADPSRWGAEHDRVPRSRFAASFSGRAVLFWPARDGRQPPDAVRRFLEA